MARRKRKKGLRPIERKAIGMLVSKDVTGQTNQDIADELGVDIKTLWQWRQKPEFIDELNEKAEEIQRGIISDAYQSLRTIINSPNSKDSNKINAIKLVLQQQGKLTDRQEITHKTDEPDITDMLSRLKAERDSMADLDTFDDN